MYMSLIFYTKIFVLFLNLVFNVLNVIKYYYYSISSDIISEDMKIAVAIATVKTENLFSVSLNQFTNFENSVLFAMLRMRGK